MINPDIQATSDYNETIIKSEYREETYLRIVSISKFTLPFYLTNVGGYFIYSDIFIRHVPFIIPWRLPSLITAVVFLLFILTPLRQSIKWIFIINNIFLFTVCLMMAGITWELFQTSLFKTSIN